MENKEVDVFYPTSPAAWRKWLLKNHVSQQSVWLAAHNKSSGKRCITWSESVDEALCFGWIDSKKIKIDHETTHQFFSKRKANGTWSKINKEKVERLIEAGLMTEAGLKMIEIAKQNGSWNILDEVEALIIPKDLETEFSKYKGSKEYFLSLSKSNKKIILSWIVLAKREETKQKRIAEIAKLAGLGEKPKHVV